MSEEPKPEQEFTNTPDGTEVPPEPANTELQEGAAAPAEAVTGEQPAESDEPTTEAPSEDAAPAQESTPAEDAPVEASSVLAFGCEHCEVVTFIGKKRHPNVGAPDIPRGVICPICGNNMPMREAIVLSSTQAEGLHSLGPQHPEEVASNA